VNIEVTPLFGNQRRALLVILEAVQSGEKRTAESQEKPLEREEAVASRDRQIAKLKREVLEVRRRLLSLVEDHQISQEESQTATADALSANEELQSLNEELETAKEELQSTNEELTTVNQELESKNVALTESRNFTNLIVKTVRVPLVVLDNELRIKTVNESFSQTFLIPPRDAEGRFLYSLGGSSWDIPGLRDLLVAFWLPANHLTILRLSGVSVDRGQKFEHQWTSPGSFRLILVAINDVTLHKEAEKAYMKARGSAPGAEDGGNRQTCRWHRPRLQQRANDDNRLQQSRRYPYWWPKGQRVRARNRKGGQEQPLTDQLLSFSRRKVLQPKVFDVNTVVADLGKCCALSLVKRSRSSFGSPRHMASKSRSW
jgi:PAS domain-containing protein